MNVTEILENFKQLNSPKKKLNLQNDYTKEQQKMIYKFYMHEIMKSEENKQ